MQEDLCAWKDGRGGGIRLGTILKPVSLYPGNGEKERRNLINPKLFGNGDVLCSRLCFFLKLIYSLELRRGSKYNIDSASYQESYREWESKEKKKREREVGWGGGARRKELSGTERERIDRSQPPAFARPL